MNDAFSTAGRLLLAAYLALLLSGCGRSPGAADAVDEIRIALAGDMRSTNPGVLRDANTDTVIHHVVESLVAYRDDLTVAPLLAQSFDVSENGTVYTFRLRRDVRFHNGEPMTSSEVKWSWQRMLDPDTGWRCRHWYDGSSDKGTEVLAVETPDPFTVVFRLAEPGSSFLDRMANVQCVTAVLHPDSLDEQGNWAGPVATGPYVIERWQRGEYILLRRFAQYQPRPEPRDGYAGGRQALTERVRFVIVPEVASGVAAIAAGDLDVIAQVPPYLAGELGANGALRLYEQELLDWSTLLINGTDPLLEDPRMRHAIAHALDPRQIAAASTFGTARPNSSAVPLLSPFHTEVHDRWWPYDAEEAKRLLELAGYDGQPIRIQTNRKFPVDFDNAIAVQAMLTAVGINAPLEVVDWATQLSDYYSHTFQLSSFGYSARTHPVLNYDTILGLRERKPSVQWEDRRALQLLDRAERTYDRTEQTRIFEELHLLMMQEVPIIGLFNDSTLDVTRASIEGYRPWPLANPRLWGVRKGR
ncbi:MAG TPA: ABC transporter substrate-binding protein [Woeseiaceae bacterium]|nr:ABC transporter substrate-binding protein [Woeseiaceae bacterium]